MCNTEHLSVVGPQSLPRFTRKAPITSGSTKADNFSHFVAVTTDVFHDSRFEKLLLLGKRWLQVYVLSKSF